MNGRECSEHDQRTGAPLWRHDAYTLRHLEAAIRHLVSDLASQAAAGSDACVVDLGAGSAPYRALFAPLASRYLACDLESAPGVDITLLPDGRVPLEEASANYVVSFQVLEHVWDIDTYLGECRRLLKPDGVLLLSTHGVWPYHPHPGDFRRWTRDGLCRELTSRGFSILSVTPLLGPLAWTTQIRLLAYRQALLQLGVVGRPLIPLLSLLMYARMWLEDRVTPHEVFRNNAAVYLIAAVRAVE